MTFKFKILVLLTVDFSLLDRLTRDKTSESIAIS